MAAPVALSSSAAKPVHVVAATFGSSALHPAIAAGSSARPEEPALPADAVVDLADPCSSASTFSVLLPLENQASQLVGDAPPPALQALLTPAAEHGPV